MRDLRAWLDSVREIPLEGMADFFAKRIGEYEAHMSPWAEAYRAIPGYLPPAASRLLDLGCGTGLELKEIFRKFPDVRVTGVDLCSAMLERLAEKFGERVEIVCGDYFDAPLGENYDAAVSVQSFHHFTPEQKETLFRRIYRALGRDGVFLECDYVACCAEEEKLLARECERKRAKEGFSPDTFVHFDTPLTLAHEMRLLKDAGFRRVRAAGCFEGAALIRCEK